MAKAKNSSARKGSARKSTAKKTAARDTAADAADRPSVIGEDKGEEAKKRANLDEALGGNILGSEPLGPGTEHEDHEGGETDSLAKRGVRGPLKPAETPDEEVVRAPSIRERQLRRGTGRGGYVRPDAVSALKAANADEKEQEPVRVVAESQGFYGNKRRHRGDVFLYTLSEGEEKLPSWVTAVDGKVESRRKGETMGVTESTIIEVHRDGGATVREGARTTTTAAGISGRANLPSAAGQRAAAREAERSSATRPRRAR